MSEISEQEIAASLAEEAPRIGGLFSRIGGAASYVASLADLAELDSMEIRRDELGNWWVELSEEVGDISSLIWGAGGRPFRRDSGTKWVAVSAAPTNGVFASSTDGVVYPGKWEESEIRELLAETPLRRVPYGGIDQVCVIVPAPLTQWALRTSLNLGLDGDVSWVRLTPLMGGTESNCLLLSLRAPKGGVPGSLVDSLSKLPHSVVAASFEVSASNRILVDVHHHLPLAILQLGQLMRPGESWLFGAPEFGRWSLQRVGRERDIASFLTWDEMPVASGLHKEPSEMPTSVPVRSIQNPQTLTAADGVLLDDQALSWLARFWRGAVMDEDSFLLLGPGAHLLLSPRSLVSSLPFGVPVTRVGPGGLFLECGVDFNPPVPMAARQKVLGLDRSTSLVVTATDRFRLQNSNLVPTWSLWIEEGLNATEGLSPEALRVLQSYSVPEPAPGTETGAPLDTRITDSDEESSENASTRARLLREAKDLELQGECFEAANRCLAAGRHEEAARLYDAASREVPISESVGTAEPAREVDPVSLEEPPPLLVRVGLAVGLLGVIGAGILFFLTLDPIETPTVSDRLTEIVGLVRDGLGIEEERVVEAYARNQPGLGRALYLCAYEKLKEADTFLTKGEYVQAAERCELASNLFRSSAHGGVRLGLESAADALREKATCFREAGSLGRAVEEASRADEAYRDAIGRYEQADEAKGVENCIYKLEMLREEVAQWRSAAPVQVTDDAGSRVGSSHGGRP